MISSFTRSGSFRAAAALFAAWSPSACQTGFPTPPTMAPPAAPGTPPPGTPVSFSTQIQPIFDARCIDCHRTGGLADFSGIRMRLTAGQSRASLVNQASAQRADLTLVVPGDASNSLLWQKVALAAPPVGARMPLLSLPLPAAQIDLIRDWINAGAPDN